METLVFTQKDGTTRILKPSTEKRHKVSIDLSGLKHDFGAITGPLVKFAKSTTTDSKEALKLAKKTFKSETIKRFGSMINYNKHVNSTKITVS